MKDGEKVSNLDQGHGQVPILQRLDKCAIEVGFHLNDNGNLVQGLSRKVI